MICAVQFASSVHKLIVPVNALPARLPRKDALAEVRHDLPYRKSLGVFSICVHLAGRSVPQRIMQNLPFPNEPVPFLDQCAYFIIGVLDNNLAFIITPCVLDKVFCHPAVEHMAGVI